MSAAGATNTVTDQCLRAIGEAVASRQLSLFSDEAVDMVLDAMTGARRRPRSARKKAAPDHRDLFATVGYITPEGRRRLFEKHLPLVHHIAKKIHSRALFNIGTVDDALQTGRVVLWQAACQYNPLHGSKFITYAFRCVMNGLLREAYRPALLTGVGKRPLEDHPRVGSLPVGYDDAPERSDGRTSEDRVANAELVQMALAAIRPEDRRMVEAVYGLDDSQPKSMEEFGTSVGLSRERVRQRLQRGYTEARAAMRDSVGGHHLELPQRPRPRNASMLSARHSQEPSMKHSEKNLSDAVALMVSRSPFDHSWVTEVASLIEMVFDGQAVPNSRHWQEHARRACKEFNIKPRQLGALVSYAIRLVAITARPYPKVPSLASLRSSGTAADEPDDTGTDT